MLFKMMLRRSKCVHYLHKSNIQKYVMYSGFANFDKSPNKSIQKHDWNRAVSEAEKIVGYPTSFLSLRWLLSDEIANVALHLRKLVGSDHPLLKTTKSLLYTGTNNMQAWGLIVLLVSKAGGHLSSIPDIEQDKSAGVLHSQRALAEVTEMIRISHLVHQGLVNLQPLIESGVDLNNLSDMTFGNKIALLTGDYLLGNSSVELARLRNQEIVELISSAVRDLSEAEFVGDRDDQNIPLPLKPGIALDSDSSNDSLAIDDMDNLQPLTLKFAYNNPEKEWTIRNLLSAGRLLGKSCQGALNLAGHSKVLQNKGYLFGKHLALAWQSCLDIEPFLHKTEQCERKRFSLVSAPVLYQLQYNTNLYKEIEKGLTSVSNVNYDIIYEEVINGPGIEKTRDLQKKHSLKALNVLNELPSNDARTALKNIIIAMQDL